MKRQVKRFVSTLVFIVIAFILSLPVKGQDNPVFFETASFNDNQALLKAHPDLEKRKLIKDKSSLRVVGSPSDVTSKPITGIPSRLNSFFLSPRHDSFVAFEETEGASDNLYFFTAEGSLMATQRVNIYPVVSYSADGEFVVAFNSFGREVFVFRKNGILMFAGDYVDLIKNNSKILYNVLVSESGAELLINAGEDVHLISTKTKLELFQTRTGRVLSGNFMTAKGKVVLQTGSEQNTKCDLIILSKSDGGVVGKLPGLSKVFFTKTGFVTFNNSKYQEYEVR